MRARCLLPAGILVSLLAAGHAEAHHIELNQFSIRPLSAAELRGRLFLNPQDFRVAGPGAKQELEGLVRQAIHLKQGGRACVPALEVLELWDGGGVEGGHLIDLHCVSESNAPWKIRWAQPHGALWISYPEKLRGVLVPTTTTVASGATATLQVGVGTQAAGAVTHAQAMPSWVEMVRMGFEHVLPDGLDHVLFVLSLGVSALGRTGTLIGLLSVFTLFHSLALWAGTMGLVRVPAKFVEPAIALSIALLAARAARTWSQAKLNPPAGWPAYLSIAAFGCVHGLGFSGAFRELSLEAVSLVPALAAFHGGVELGQLGVLGLGQGWLHLLMRKQPPERARRLATWTASLYATLGFALFVFRAFGTVSR
jgi:HupE / UreJ protein